MSILFSDEFFGITMTLAGCMIYTSGDFSIPRTAAAVLLTAGGIAVTCRTSRKWLLVVHVLAWAAALALPVLPKPLGNLLSVLYTAALIPLILNGILRILWKLAGVGNDPPGGG